MKKIYFVVFGLMLLFSACSFDKQDLKGQWEYFTFAGQEVYGFDEPYLNFSEDSILITNFNHVSVTYGYEIEKDSLVLLGKHEVLKFSFKRFRDTLLIDSSIYVRNDSLVLKPEIDLLGIEGLEPYRYSNQSFFIMEFAVFHEESNAYFGGQDKRILAGGKNAEAGKIPLYLEFYHNTRPIILNIYPDANLKFHHYYDILLLTKFTKNYRINIITNKSGIDKIEGFLEFNHYWEEEFDDFFKRKPFGRSQPPPLPPPFPFYSLNQLLKEAKPLSIIMVSPKGIYDLKEKNVQSLENILNQENRYYLFVYADELTLENYARFRIELQKQLAKRKETKSQVIFNKPYVDLSLEEKRLLSSELSGVYFTRKSLFESLVN